MMPARIIKPEPLSLEAFLPFGRYGHLTNPAGEKIGDAPIEFFRDMLPLDLGGSRTASFSVCRVEDRDLVINTSECHSICGEGIMPLDGDVLFHVGPATPPGEAPPLDRFRVFKIPCHTFVALDPGVWHHAPYSVSGAPVNCLIVLPVRTYAADCSVVEIPEKDWIRIKA
jgi:ureidoglycolate hydrolase